MLIEMHSVVWCVQTFRWPPNVLPATVIHVKHVNGAFKCKFGTNSRWNSLVSVFHIFNFPSLLKRAYNFPSAECSDTCIVFWKVAITSTHIYDVRLNTMCMFAACACDSSEFARSFSPSLIRMTVPYGYQHLVEPVNIWQFNINQQRDSHFGTKFVRHILKLANTH